MTTLSLRLGTRLELYGSLVADAQGRFWEPQTLRSAYPAFLRLQLETIKASSPLMEEAASEMDRREQDPLREPLGLYFRRHADEERDHVEWLLEDLRMLGVDPEGLHGQAPSPTSASMVGAQCYWMRYAHPVALLGYLVALEWAQPDPEFYDRAADQAGLPREAFTCLRRHAELDPYHRRDLEELMDTLPVDPSQEDLIGLSLLHTCHGASARYEAAMAG